jgi:hypothetical protein
MQGGLLQWFLAAPASVLLRDPEAMHLHGMHLLPLAILCGLTLWLGSLSVVLHR